MAKKSTKKITVEKPKFSILDRMEHEVQANQSRVSLVLGALIVIVVGILLFNYFNKNKTAGVTSNAVNTQLSQDVTTENLPGKYTVKENDTLFLIAEKYYKDGYKYDEIVKANNLQNADIIATGQVLEIPKIDLETNKQSTLAPSPSLEQSTEITEPAVTAVKDQAMNQLWGESITGTTYTVVSGDWLSTIAGRSYGDVMSYEKIAKANNILDPNLIEPGMVLTIPR